MLFHVQSAYMHAGSYTHLNHRDICLHGLIAECKNGVCDCINAEASHEDHMTQLHLDYKQLYVNPLPTIRNSLKKHKTLYKVLTPNIKSPNSNGLMGAHDAYMRHLLVKS